MRALILPCTIALLLLLVQSDERSPSVARPERLGEALKLVLQSRMRSGQALESGQYPNFRLAIFNSSRQTSIPVVLPGDGSEVGWREPYIYFTATIRNADGFETDVLPERYGRCKLFDWRWPQSAVLLPPREGHYLEVWRPLLEFQEAGRVRLIAHYNYSAGTGRGSRVSAFGRDRLGMMKDVPQFELVSNPIEFEVIRPVDLEIRVKSPMKAGVKHRLSDILEVDVINRSSIARELAHPSGYPWPRLHIDLEGDFGGWRPRFEESPGDDWPSCKNLPILLPPGSKAALIGVKQLDGSWEYPRADKVKVRACFMVGERGGPPVVMSDWVEIRVVE